jgi:hypothetical protein
MISITGRLFLKELNKPIIMKDIGKKKAMNRLTLSLSIDDFNVYCYLF